MRGLRTRARDRARHKASAARRAREHRSSIAWRRGHPEAARAHRAVAYALRTGKLVRGPCEVCGKEAVPGDPTQRIHAHHDDYLKPLEVRWVCPAHHGDLRRL